MQRRASVLMVAILLMSLVPGAVFAGPPAPPSLLTLQPGGYRDIEQDLTINVVFVGYEQGAGPLDVDESGFLAGLSQRYQTINRYPPFYGLPGGLGINFDFDYNLVYADSTFEDAFFSHLSSIAEPKPLTAYQELYNEQAGNSLEIAGNHWISAPAVEQWLADNANGMLGIDTEQYTVFLVNWYGRPDFKFHVYTKIGEPDPDTGYDFGLLRESRKLIAWGGTTPDDEESGLGSLHRIWFYDLSAGPESWTANWNVDDADLDGNGAMDYRMPPVWEYGNMAAYRPFDDLSGDLAKIVRYVAINLLYTASPLYKPAISPPALPSEIQLDINVYQADPDVDGKDYFDPGLISDELGELQPLNSFSVELNDAAWTNRTAEVYNCFIWGPSCYGNRLYGISFGDLFLYTQDHLLQFLEGDADYEVPFVAYNLTSDLDVSGLLGYADDNWRDGTQSYVFGFDSPGTRAAGYGFTTTTIHEVGHHLGLSHPHDGYDWEANVDYGPGDDFYFAWSGDESNSMMSYIDVNWDFSQFDRDNMNRYLTSIYINTANLILGDIYKSAKAASVAPLLLSADGRAAAALTAYGAMDYGAAAAQAKSAYEDVLAAAAQIKIPVEPQSWQADYKSKGQSSKFIDRLDYHRNAP